MRALDEVSAEFGQELVGVRYQRKLLPEKGGYVCDANGVIDANTIATMLEVSYLHSEAVSAVRSLIRSHEALRHRAEQAEREREELKVDHTDALDAYRQMYESELDRAEQAERERDQFASMLHDCENERDGWKHRAERMERVVEAARAFVYCERTDNVAQLLGAMGDAVRALDSTPTPEARDGD